MIEGNMTAGNILPDGEKTPLLPIYLQTDGKDRELPVEDQRFLEFYGDQALPTFEYAQKTASLRDQDGIELFKRVINAYEMGDMDATVRLSEELVAKFNTYWPAYIYLSAGLAGIPEYLHRVPDVLDIAKAGIMRQLQGELPPEELAPTRSPMDRTQLQENLWNVYMNMADYSEAVLDYHRQIRNLNEALQIARPDQRVIVLLLLASAQLRLGERSEALGSLRRAEEHDPVAYAELLPKVKLTCPHLTQLQF